MKLVFKVLGSPSTHQQLQIFGTLFNTEVEYLKIETKHQMLIQFNERCHFTTESHVIEEIHCKTDATKVVLFSVFQLVNNYCVSN